MRTSVDSRGVYFSAALDLGICGCFNPPAGQLRQQQCVLRSQPDGSGRAVAMLQLSLQHRMTEGTAAPNSPKQAARPPIPVAGKQPRAATAPGRSKADSNGDGGASAVLQALPGIWHAVGVVETGEEMGEQFILRRNSDGSVSGGSLPANTDDIFEIGAVTVVPDDAAAAAAAAAAADAADAATSVAIRFVQTYPDGAKTSWEATVRWVENQSGDSDVSDMLCMREGRWEGACNGKFSAAQAPSTALPSPKTTSKRTVRAAEGMDEIDDFAQQERMAIATAAAEERRQQERAAAAQQTLADLSGATGGGGSADRAAATTGGKQPLAVVPNAMVKRFEELSEALERAITDHANVSGTPTASRGRSRARRGGRADSAQRLHSPGQRRQNAGSSKRLGSPEKKGAWGSTRAKSPAAGHATTPSRRNGARGRSNTDWAALVGQSLGKNGGPLPPSALPMMSVSPHIVPNSLGLSQRRLASPEPTGRGAWGSTRAASAKRLSSPTPNRRHHSRSRISAGAGVGDNGARRGSGTGSTGAAAPTDAGSANSSRRQETIDRLSSPGRMARVSSPAVQRRLGSPPSKQLRKTEADASQSAAAEDLPRVATLGAGHVRRTQTGRPSSTRRLTSPAAARRLGSPERPHGFGSSAERLGSPQPRSRSNRGGPSGTPRDNGSAAGRMGSPPRRAAIGSSSSGAAAAANRPGGSSGDGGRGAQLVPGTAVLARSSIDGQWREGKVIRAAGSSSSSTRKQLYVLELTAGGGKLAVHRETVPRAQIVERTGPDSHKSISDSLTRSGGVVQQPGLDVAVEAAVAQPQGAASVGPRATESTSGKHSLSPSNGQFAGAAERRHENAVSAPGPMHLDDLGLQRFLVDGFVAVDGSTAPLNAAASSSATEASRPLHTAVGAALTGLASTTTTGGGVLGALLQPYLQRLCAPGLPVYAALESLLGRQFALQLSSATLLASAAGTAGSAWCRARSATARHPPGIGGQGWLTTHRPRELILHYFPCGGSLELGSCELAAGSQYCCIQPATPSALGPDASTSHMVEWMGVEEWPSSWGGVRTLVLPAGAMLITHPGLWMRHAANTATATATRLCVQLPVLRMEEPDPLAPSWRRTGEDGTWRAKPGSAPPELQLLWSAAWNWLCGAAGGSAATGDGMTVARALQAMNAASRSPISAPAAEPPRWPAPIGNSALSATATDGAAGLLHAKLKRAQAAVIRAEKALQVALTQPHQQPDGTIDSHEPEPEMTVSSGRVAKALLEAEARLEDTERQAKQDLRAAGDETARLRRELRADKSVLEKTRVRLDGLQQRHQQLQGRMLTIAAAARSKTPWNHSWDEWLPGGFGRGANQGSWDSPPPVASPYTSSPPTAKEKQQPKLQGHGDDYPDDASLAAWGGEFADDGGGFGLLEASNGGANDGLGGWSGADDDHDAADGMRGGSFHSPTAASSRGMSGGADGASGYERGLGLRLATGNAGLELELRVQEAIGRRLDTIQNAAVGALAAGLTRRLLHSALRHWSSWSIAQNYRRNVLRAMLRRSTRARKAKAWRAWMSWAASKQMEERIQEIQSDARTAAASAAGTAPLGQPLPHSPSSRNAAEMRAATLGEVLAATNSSAPSEAELSAALGGLHAAYWLSGQETAGAEALTRCLLGLETVAETTADTGAWQYNLPCAQQYVGKIQSCMVIIGRLTPHAPVP
eukprot:COSAG05_NODE_193_length_14574_cov_23.070812_4_plen_1690_part_00